MDFWEEYELTLILDLLKDFNCALNIYNLLYAGSKGYVASYLGSTRTCCCCLCSPPHLMTIIFLLLRLSWHMHVHIGVNTVS